MTETLSPEPLAEALAGMARDLLAQETMQETLDRIVAHAVSVVDACEVAGLMVVRGGQVTTLAATDELARASERWQGEVGEGPCLDAYRESEPVFRISDVPASKDRWPQYAPKAQELGIGSTMGFLLFAGDEDQHLGVLNLYSSQRGAFTTRSEQVGLLLASHASVAFAGARHESQLREAVATRQSIGEAVGVAMERHKLTAEEAFALLASASQHANIKLRDLATEITRTGEIPATDR